MNPFEQLWQYLFKLSETGIAYSPDDPTLISLVEICSTSITFHGYRKAILPVTHEVKNAFVEVGAFGIGAISSLWKETPPTLTAYESQIAMRMLPCQAGTLELANAKRTIFQDILHHYVWHAQITPEMRSQPLFNRHAHWSASSGETLSPAQVRCALNSYTTLNSESRSGHILSTKDADKIAHLYDKYLEEKDKSISRASTNTISHFVLIAFLSCFFKILTSYIIPATQSRCEINPATVRIIRHILSCWLPILNTIYTILFITPSCILSAFIGLGGPALFYGLLEYCRSARTSIFLKTITSFLAATSRFYSIYMDGARDLTRVARSLSFDTAVLLGSLSAGTLGELIAWKIIHLLPKLKYEELPPAGLPPQIPPSPTVGTIDSHSGLRRRRSPTHVFSET